jgi:sortase (surface protein transpeptidase)
MNPNFVPGWMRTAPILVVVVVAMAGSAAFAPAPVAASQASAAPGWAAEVNVARAAPRPQHLPLPDGAVGRLTIASIDVDAIARRVGLTAGGAMDVTPNIWDVGVFDGGVQPGHPGSAVIEGHLDWTTGPAVFWNLHRLGMGDEVDYADADGTEHRFAVSRVRNIPWNSAIPDDLFATSGTPTLTMITCSGTWISSAHSYSTRLLLTATEITS